MRDLRNKRVLITGAGRGLGRALALRFARAGAVVVVTDRYAALLEGVVADLKAGGGSASGLPLDVTDEAQVTAVRDQVRAEGGPIDVLINNAGVVFGGPFLDVPSAKHRTTVAVNLIGLLTVTHAFLPDLIGRPEAHLVNIASATAFSALPWAASYAATKWAVLGFTESLREELRLLGHRQVGMTAVCPSFIDTGLFAGAKAPRLTWVLTPEGVAEAVFQAVRRRRDTVILPWTVRLLAATVGLLPRRWFHRVCGWLGVSTSMKGWQGHARSDAQGPLKAGARSLGSWE
jgi:short-subunit dehydrogenase